MPDLITFTRNGQVRRGDIRVGWISRRDDYGPVSWRLRLTPASGKQGIVGDFDRLRDAKAAALKELSSPASTGDKT